MAEEVYDEAELDKKSMKTGIANKLYVKHCARNPVIEQLKQQSGSSGILQTPKGQPVAQSTVYNIKTPKTLLLEDKKTMLQYEQQAGEKYSAIRNGKCNVPALLPKASTEKSLFMNELAIKYLPNDKLAELFQDMSIDSLDTNQLDHVSNVRLIPPLRSVENFEKKSTEISNDSYKYLKKYRLLPEDYADSETLADSEQNSPNALSQNYHQARSDCVGAEVMAGGGKSSRYNTTTRGGSGVNALYREKCVPRLVNGRRLPTSPLAKSLSPNNAKASLPKSPLANNMLDLDNIKQQPKLL